MIGIIIMGKKFIFLFLLVIFIIQNTLQLHAKEFKIFDGTLYLNKPDLSEYGIKNINIYYGTSLWPGGTDKSELPKKSIITSMATKASINNNTTILDIEEWPLSRVSDKIFYKNLNKYITVIKWFKNVAPNIEIGYYALPPTKAYHRILKGKKHKEYIEWKNKNNMTKPLANLVDILCPSLYTAKRKKAEWAEVAIENIKEAKRIGNNKPVYVFLWPFYDKNPATKKRDIYKYIGADYWRLQLKTVKDSADGVIIWGGWDFQKWKRANWEESAMWWIETKKFINDLHY
jgi:hypothetical protein